MDRLRILGELIGQRYLFFKIKVKGILKVIACMAYNRKIQRNIISGVDRRILMIFNFSFRFHLTVHVFDYVLGDVHGRSGILGVTALEFHPPSELQILMKVGWVVWMNWWLRFCGEYLTIIIIERLGNFAVSDSKVIHILCYLLIWRVSFKFNYKFSK